MCVCVFVYGKHSPWGAVDLGECRTLGRIGSSSSCCCYMTPKIKNKTEQQGDK